MTWGRRALAKHGGCGPDFGNRKEQIYQYQETLAAVGSLRRKSLTDMGCGYGDLVNYLPRSTQYLGIDSNLVNVGIATVKYPHHHFICGRECAPADVVVAVGVATNHANEMGPREFLEMIWGRATEIVAATIWKDPALSLEEVAGWWAVPPRIRESASDFWTMSVEK